LEKRALNYYTNAADGLGEFDKLFAANATDTLTYLTWLSQMPDGTAFTDPTQYAAAMSAWQAAKPTLTTEAGKALEDAVGKWQRQKLNKVTLKVPSSTLPPLPNGRQLHPQRRRMASKLLI